MYSELFSNTLSFGKPNLLHWLLSEPAIDACYLMFS